MNPSFFNSRNYEIHTFFPIKTTKFGISKHQTQQMTKTNKVQIQPNPPKD